MRKTWLAATAAMLVVALATVRMADAQGAGDALSCKRALPAGFVAAELVDKPFTKYPKEALIDGNEGWVQVGFSVSAAGAVQTPEVLDASAPDVLRGAALRSISLWTFRPATRNGKPVEEANRVADYMFRYISGPSALPTDASHEVVYVQLAPENIFSSTHEEFQGTFKKANDLIAAQKLAEAREALEGLLSHRLNMYERARIAMTLSGVYAQMGDNAKAYHHILHATARDGESIEQRRRGEAFALRMKLAVQNGDFVDAACAREKLSSLDPASVAAGAPASRMFDAIRGIVANPAPMQIPVKLAAIPDLGQPAGWQHQMMRTHFSFAQIQGSAGTFRLSCTGTVLEAAIDEEQQWTIPPEAGACTLRLAGAEGTTLKLVEE